MEIRHARLYKDERVIVSPQSAGIGVTYPALSPLCVIHSSIIPCSFEAGFDIRPGTHPPVPIMVCSARLAQDFARDFYDESIEVIGFSYPVVPRGEAPIRIQLSAAP